MAIRALSLSLTLAIAIYQKSAAALRAAEGALSSDINYPVLDPSKNSSALTFDVKYVCSGELIHGISNSLNDCFLSAMVQLILNSPPVCRTVLSEEHVIAKSCNPVPELRAFLAKYLRARGPSKQDTRAFRNRLRHLGVTEGVDSQEDASEAFTKLLSLYNVVNSKDQNFLTRVRVYRQFKRLDVQISAASPSSGADTICNGASCETSGVSTVSPMLSLELQGKDTSLTSLYEMAFQKELKDDPENALEVRLPSDGRHGAGQVGKVSKYEVITADESKKPATELFLHIKRFEYDFVTESTVKRHGRIDAPFLWTRPGGPLYDLVGLVVHHGQSGMAGHYTAFRRRANGTWVEANDAQLKTTSAKAIRGAAAKALVLQYRVRGPPDDVEEKGRMREPMHLASLHVPKRKWTNGCHPENKPCKKRKRNAGTSSSSSTPMTG